METNIVEMLIVPDKPKILKRQQIYVYVPIVGPDTPGIAKFDKNQFIINPDGTIKLFKGYIWQSGFSYDKNEIAYYAAYGLFGAYVRSKVDDNINNEPFNMNGVLNEEYWEIVFDFNSSKIGVYWGFNGPVNLKEV